MAHAVATHLSELQCENEALLIYRRSVDEGEVCSLRSMGGSLARLGRVDEAIAVYLRAAEAGDSKCLDMAATLLVDHNRSVDADQLRRYGLEPGGTISARWTARKGSGSQ